MKIFKNKVLVKLIAAICLILTILNVAGASRVYAEDDDEVWGGVLINPITKLLTAIGDSIMEILHASIQSQQAAIVRVSGSADWWDKMSTVLAIVAAILVAVIVIAAVVATAGLAAAAAAAIATGTATFTVSISTGAVVAGMTAGVVAGIAVKQATIPNDIYLPAFSITAEEIFRNELPLFDVNFFNPNEYYTTEYTYKDSSEVVESDSHLGQYQIWEIGSLWDEINNSPGVQSSSLGAQTMSIQKAFEYQAFKQMIEKVNAHLDEIGASDKKVSASQNFDFKIYDVDTSESYMGKVTSEFLFSKMIEDASIQKYRFDIINQDSNELYMTILYYSNYVQQYSNLDPAGKTETYSQYLEYQLIQQTSEGGTGDYVAPEYEAKEVKVASTAEQLREIISTWYFILRNIALLVLMVVLIYTGIRIVIGSTAGEKAKYKERLTDWLVAMCLLFVMHYIMVFSVELVEKITELVGKTINGNVAVITLTDKQYTNAQEVLDSFIKEGTAKITVNNAGENVLEWPTDLAGVFRIQSQMIEEGTSKWVGYSFCYVILVLFTLFFAWTYLKRVLYMAFLTMIAPLVAMTYPIDKITDGKAQAFDSWLKEYIFNLMIQPLHLLLYTILVSSAFSLATSSPIYALVSIGFMMPAEKLLRRFFGFEKAKTPGLLGGAAGAALAMSGLQKIMGHGKGGKHGSGGDGSKEKSNNKGPRYTKNESGKPVDTMLGDVQLDGNEGSDIRLNGQDSQGANIGDENADNGDSSSMDEHSGRGPVLPGNESQNGDQELPKKPQKVNVSKKSATPEEVARMRGQQEARRINEERQREAELKRKQEADEQAKIRARAEAQRQKEEEKRAQEAAQKAKENTTWKRLKRTVAGASKAYVRGMGQKAYKRIKSGKPIRAMLRGAAGLAGGALLGGAGLALGISSGDPTKALQYTGAGAMGGYSLGKGVANSAVDTFSVDSGDMQEEVERSWYDQDYAEHKYEEIEEENLMSESNIAYYRDVKGGTREEAEEFLDTTGREYYRSKVTDVGDMLAIEATVQEESTDAADAISRDEAIAATKLKKSMSQNVKDMSYKKEQEYRDTYRRAYEEKLKNRYPGWKDNKALQKKIETISNEKADKTIRIMKTLETNKSNLTTL